MVDFLIHHLGVEVFGAIDEFGLREVEVGSHHEGRKLVLVDLLWLHQSLRAVILGVEEDPVGDGRRTAHFYSHILRALNVKRLWLLSLCCREKFARCGDFEPILVFNLLLVFIDIRPLVHGLFHCCRLFFLLFEVLANCFLHFVFQVDSHHVFLALLLELLKDFGPVGLFFALSQEVFLPELVDFSVFAVALARGHVPMIILLDEDVLVTEHPTCGDDKHV